jgi:hypothetical protein
MIRRNNKRLYESIMKDISKTVKRYLKEGNSSDYRYSDYRYSDEDENSFKHYIIIEFIYNGDFYKETIKVDDIDTTNDSFWQTDINSKDDWYTLEICGSKKNDRLLTDVWIEVYDNIGNNINVLEYINDIKVKDYY